MQRRDFITLVGAVATAWPLGARAQQLPTIGFLGTDPSLWASWVAAFVQRLGDLGWIEGRTVKLIYRWSEGRPDRTAEIAAEFVRLKVNVIIAVGPAAVRSKQATSVIPIVFPIGPDPVGSGLVESLARPGGNATGLSLQSTDFSGKRLDLLRQVVPQLRRLAIMGDADFADAVLEMSEASKIARSLGLSVVLSEIRRVDDIVPAFTELNGQADALYVVVDNLIAANHKLLIAQALGARLPTMVLNREFVQAGALMAYGPNFPALFRRAAEFVDKIFRGTKPGDIPIEQPTKFDFTINLTTAKALDISVPASILSLADEVID